MNISSKLLRVVRKIYKYFEYRYYRKLLSKNTSLQNKFLGKRIFVLGDGISLNDIDLPRLKNEFIFGCNHLMLHKDFQNLDVNFYSLIEPWRVAKHDRTRILGTLLNAFYYLDDKIKHNHTRLFFSASMKKVIEDKQIFKENEKSYFVSGRHLIEGPPFEIDLSKPFSSADGSLYFMMATSIFMGFKEIYICGAGYTYSPQQQTHFYDNFNKVVDEAPDPRHALMMELAKQNDVSLFNITPRGHQSLIYPEIRIEDVYEVIEPKQYQERIHASS